MQQPIQSGTIVKDGSLRTSHPVNLRHKIVESGISEGELLSVHGVETMATGPGGDRGGIVWNTIQYRAMGDKLVTVAVNGAVTILGTIASDGLPCRFTYSFDRLAIASAEKLYYWDGLTLIEVTDPDLGVVIDVTWIDGYFATTDGTSIVLTNLSDPTAVDPLRYGSAESDPDPMTGIDRIGDELVGFGRHSIQYYQNVGTTGFPFASVGGATIPYGCVSPNAKCHIGATMAFVGSGRDEPLGIYVIAQGTAVRISDEQIEERLRECGQPETLTMESRSFGFEEQLVVHIEHCSMALALRGSQIADGGLWHILKGKGGAYRPRNAVWCYGAHYAADIVTGELGKLDDAITAQFGDEPEWAFDVGLLYNDGRSFILRETEITGQFPQTPGAVFFSMTRDGELWSREVMKRLTGRRDQRVVWRPNIRVSRICGFHFRGHGVVALARADVQAEPL